MTGKFAILIVAAALLSACTSGSETKTPQTDDAVSQSVVAETDSSGPNVCSYSYDFRCGYSAGYSAGYDDQQRATHTGIYSEDDDEAAGSEGYSEEYYEEEYYE